MELHCKTCNTHLGTVRDGRMRNNLVCYCASCDAQRLAREKELEEGTSPFEDLLGLFSKPKK